MKLAAREISFAYGRQLVLDDVSIDVREGELLGIIGPNGAGKSTLLRCLYGSIRPQKGGVMLDQRTLSEESRREIARVIGVVPQRCDITFPVSVTHFVGLGRFAREAWLGGPSDTDRAVVRACLAEMRLEHLAERPVDALSGGEFRRVLIAQALAQEPRILLFDEPVQQLDLLHQLEVMEFARAFTRRGDTSGVVVLHDLALAARYCDRLVLLQAGRIAAEGAPEEVLTADHVRSAFGIHARIERSAATGTIQVIALEAAECTRTANLVRERESS